ncbi:DUF5357 family protein [Geitlerinema sp. PCC 7407]|uniref:DUF5357 family protein n=1 Tax=Geitlerinema sp. PCC 7407 TaxID=1173025 RepID=UPI00029FDDE1|nr:DUF5357 family protein [Geitlerinema sp. PCC 7407]AFY67599.1 hypothetical protein GEI7407_3131 [Geitlerinema sp. PCC 7407]
MKLILALLKRLFLPPTWVSWQTPILLSLLAWVMSLPAGPLAREILAVAAWIFLIIGVSWIAASQEKLAIGTIPLWPWLTSALICLFLFGSQSDTVPSYAVVSWPIISAIIFTLLAFVERGTRFKIPDAAVRQQLIILVLSQLLVSCWLQFYFLLGTWLEAYPSLLADSFRRSAFVVSLAEELPEPEGGVLLLNQAERVFQERMENRPWPEVERWLVDIRSDSTALEAFEEAVFRPLNSPLSPSRERELWHLRLNIVGQERSYQMPLEAVWLGPTSMAEQVRVLQRTCEVSRVREQQEGERQPAGQTGGQPIFETVGNVECGPVVDSWRTRSVRDEG